MNVNIDPAAIFTAIFSGIKDLLGLNSYQDVKDHLGSLVHQVTDLASFVQVMSNHQATILAMLDEELTKIEDYFDAFTFLAILQVASVVLAMAVTICPPHRWLKET